MRGAHQEIVLIREALEGFLTPEVATAILFDSLALVPGPPKSLEDARSFVGGALTTIMSRRLRPDEVATITPAVREIIDAAIARDGLDVDIEFDPLMSDAGVSGEGAEAAGSTETQQMSTITRPVPVVVVSESPLFGDRLALCLGEDRVYTTTVGSAAALRKSLFALSPMLVVLDGSAAVGLDIDALSDVLRGFPDNVVAVLWAGETEWGQRLLAHAPRKPGVVTLERGEGIEPLCDLVLSRFRGD